jgi:hypothetical protein
MLTAERLREVLEYDPGTGRFTWRIRHRRIGVGAEAGSIDRRGYVRIRIGGKRYAAHRLAWLYVHAAWPSDQIDHIDGNPRNNRLANLRVATNSQNQGNSRRRRHSASGFKGAYYHKPSGRWRAAIRKDGVRIQLGRFDTPEEAHAAYCKAAAALHGEFARAA